MKIADKNHARNWVHNLERLHHAFVLVDEDGNVHCLKSAKDMATIATAKESEKKGYHIVKGKLPDDFVSTIKEEPAIQEENQDASTNEKPIEDAK